MLNSMTMRGGVILMGIAIGSAYVSDLRSENQKRDESGFLPFAVQHPGHPAIWNAPHITRYCLSKTFLIFTGLPSMSVPVIVPHFKLLGG
jgi:hypothetical protein